VLRKAGFSEVYNLKGGILAWESANLPLTRKKR
jgi:rhodanese-related sulfurtransferase